MALFEKKLVFNHKNNTTTLNTGPFGLRKGFFKIFTIFVVILNMHIKTYKPFGLAVSDEKIISCHYTFIHIRKTVIPRAVLHEHNPNSVGREQLYDV